MPFEIRLAQAIRDENARALQQQIFHIVGPGTLLLLFVGLVGSLAVRLVGAPAVFGGGAWDVIGYGFLGVVMSLWLSKRYVLDRWLDAWYHIEKVRQANVAKIEAVIARMEAEERQKAEAAGKAETAAAPRPDPWRRALSTPPAEGEAALNPQS